MSTEKRLEWLRQAVQNLFIKNGQDIGISDQYIKVDLSIVNQYFGVDPNELVTIVCHDTTVTKELKGFARKTVRGLNMYHRHFFTLPRSKSFALGVALAKSAEEFRDVTETSNNSPAIEASSKVMLDKDWEMLLHHFPAGRGKRGNVDHYRKLILRFKETQNAPMTAKAMRKDYGVKPPNLRSLLTVKGVSELFRFHEFRDPGVCQNGHPFGTSEERDERLYHFVKVDAH